MTNNKVMYRCEKCGEDTMDYDYTFMNIGDKEFEVTLYDCINCGQYTKVREMTKEYKKRWHESVKRQFGFD